MPTLFCVEDQHISALSPPNCTKYFRNLIWAEATRCNIAFDNIRVSLDETVPDGGIDATITAPDHIEGSMLRQGLTGFQIKSGESFNPTQDSAIRKELFDNNDPIAENLKPNIKRCLDEGGRYILVCMKKQLNDQQINLIITNIKSKLEICGYSNVEIDVWGQSEIIGFSGRYPSLRVAVSTQSISRIQDYQSWKRDGLMETNFKTGEKQNIIK